MEDTKKLNKFYDYVLVGYNFASLAYAYKLHKEAKNFCIIDSSHISLQPTKMIPSLNKAVYSRLPFVPWSDEKVMTPEVQDLVGEGQILEGTPLTFDKGDFKSFLGFGNAKINEIDLVTQYCSTKNIFCPDQPEKVWLHYIEVLGEHLFLDQEVTDIAYSDNNVTDLTLNGKTKITGNQFVFFSYFPFLFEKVGNEIKSLASKMAKVKWFSSTSLIIHHKEVPQKYELNQLYLLMGSKEQSCLGMFSQIGDQVISRWESFFPSELAPDSETTAATFKEIKKQVRRAFPEVNNENSVEHILLHNPVYGDLTKLSLECGKLGNFNNLAICSSLFSGVESWLGEILSAESLSLDFSSKENGSKPAIEVAAPSTP